MNWKAFLLALFGIPAALGFYMALMYGAVKLADSGAPWWIFALIILLICATVIGLAA